MEELKLFKYTQYLCCIVLFSNLHSSDVELENAIKESIKSAAQRRSPEQKENADLLRAIQESMGITESQAIAHALAESNLEQRGKTTFTITGEPVLQFSYINDNSNLNAPLIQSKGLTFFGYVPLVGHYANPYVMLNPLAIIENRLSMLPNMAPDALLKELGPLLSAPDAEKKVNFYTLVWGMPIGEAPKDRQYNLIYHAAVVAWLKNSAGFNENNFGIKIPMGIFNANGILPAAEASAPFNSVKTEDISIHPAEANKADSDQAFSPNNMRFIIAPDRNIATFWSIAYDPDKTRASVAFHIIVLNEDIQNALLQQKRGIKTPERFFEKLKSAVGIFDANDNDKEAYGSAYQMLRPT